MEIKETIKMELYIYDNWIKLRMATQGKKIIDVKGECTVSHKI